MNAAKPGAQRVRESEARKREQGLRKTWVWAYPEDREAIHKYAERLRKKRERDKSG